MMSKPLVLVHGGAGDIPSDSRKKHAKGCHEAALAGGEVVLSGGSAVVSLCCLLLFFNKRFSCPGRRGGRPTTPF